VDDFRKNAFTEALAVAKELPLIRLTIRFYHLCVSLLLVRGAYGRVITTSDGREVASTIVEYRVYCVREVFLGRGQAALLLELAGFFSCSWFFLTSSMPTSTHTSPNSVSPRFSRGSTDCGCDLAVGRRGSILWR